MEAHLNGGENSSGVISYHNMLIKEEKESITAWFCVLRYAT
jgi:hypothetical protein